MKRLQTDREMTVASGHSVWALETGYIQPYFCSSLLSFLYLFVTSSSKEIIIYIMYIHWYSKSLNFYDGPSRFVWQLDLQLSCIVAVSYIGGGPGENHRPVASHWQTLSHDVVHLALIEIRTHHNASVVIGTDWIGSCKSNCHTNRDGPS
jgi:hypothetical protein